MEKKNKTSIIIIVLFGLIILGLVGYICYDKGVFDKKESSNNNGNTNITDSNNDTKEIALDDARFYNIYENKAIKTYTYEQNRSDGWQSFSDVELFSIITSELKESDFVKITETTNLGTVNYSLENSMVINYLKKYFGSSVKVDGNRLINPSNAYAVFYNNPAARATFDGGDSIFIYGYSDDKYKIAFSAMGGHGINVTPKITERKIISAVIENDEIVVKEKAIYLDYPNLYGDVSDVIYTIYSDVNKTNKIDSKKYTIDNFTDGVITVEDYLDKASTITTIYAYDKDTDSYYFKSSVIE